MGNHHRNRPNSMFCSHCRYSRYGVGGKRWCPQCQTHREFAYYIPTPEEIKAACLEIQSHWSDEEREWHSAYKYQPAEIHAHYGRQ